MQKTDCRNLGILILVVLLIFFPLCYAHYFYTDELVHLWFYRKGADYGMFTPQGRFLTDVLLRAAYSRVDTIAQLTWLRIGALVVWIFCLPVWYVIIQRVVRQEKLSTSLTFLAVLYLITSLPFAVSVQWMACMELSLANTAALIAGYCAYCGLGYRREGNEGGSKEHGRGYGALWLGASLVLGLVALSFYQSAIGCFLLPFFLYLLGAQKVDKRMLLAIGSYLFIFVCYFLLFKWEIKLLIYRLAIVPDWRRILSGSLPI